MITRSMRHHILRAEVHHQHPLNVQHQCHSIASSSRCICASTPERRPALIDELSKTTTLHHYNAHMSRFKLQLIAKSAECRCTHTRQLNITHKHLPSTECLYILSCSSPDSLADLSIGSFIASDEFSATGSPQSADSWPYSSTIYTCCKPPILGRSPRLTRCQRSAPCVVNRGSSKIE